MGAPDTIQPRASRGETQSRCSRVAWTASRVVTALALCVAFSLATACTASDVREDASSGDALAPVHIDGSNGVMPLMRAIAEAYVEDNPDATVTFGNGLGSRTRIDSLRAGRMDIAIASHGLDTAALRAEGLMVHRIAVTPVVIGVHAASVSLSGLASAQLCDVLAGRATSWRQLGDGRDLPVAVVVRPESEVDMEVLRAQVPCAADLVISPTAQVVEETADMQRALLNTEGALGITTATVAQQSDGAIRALTLDGVAPNDAAVRSGEYGLVRSAYLVTRADPGSAVEALLRFIASERGRNVMAENGAIAR